MSKVSASVSMSALASRASAMDAPAKIGEGNVTLRVRRGPKRDLQVLEHGRSGAFVIAATAQIIPQRMFHRFEVLAKHLAKTRFGLAGGAESFDEAGELGRV